MSENMKSILAVSVVVFAAVGASVAFFRAELRSQAESMATWTAKWNAAMASARFESLPVPHGSGWLITYAGIEYWVQSSVPAAERAEVRIVATGELVTRDLADTLRNLALHLQHEQDAKAWLSARGRGREKA